MKLMTKAVALAAVAGLAIASSQVEAASLKVGAKAPAMKIAKWVKGTPVTTFAPGKIYVVEFWATWCGPCKATIPHLTEMAKKYKNKVTFAGISVWEDDSSAKTGSTKYFETVDKFVKGMGGKMNYNVGIDDPKGAMAKNWMQAAGQNGIPTAFIVGKKGSVEWIGHPMEMEEPLAQIVAGKFNAAAAAKQAETKRAAGSDIQEKFQSAMAKIQSGKTDEGFADLDKLAADVPQLKEQLPIIKFSALLKKDEQAAYELAKKVGANEYKDNAMALNQLAWSIVDEKGLKSPDYALAVTLAERAVEVTKGEDAAVLDTLALAQFKSGKKEDAIATQEKAVALLPKAQIPDQMKAEIKARLAEFKKGS